MQESIRKLLVIIHGFPPYSGGAENAAFYLARAAAKAGVEVTVLTSDIGGRLPVRETTAGIRVIHIPAPKARWARHTVPELAGFLLSAIRRMPEWSRETDPDAILAHFTLPAGEIARQLARRRAIPYSVVLHGSDVPGYQPARFRWIHPLTVPLARRVWAGARRVIAVSDNLAALARKTAQDCSIEAIPNGVDTEAFSPDPSRRAAFPPSPLRVIAVAQLIERKGLRHLVDALAMMPSDERRAYSLVIYGSGPMESALRDQVRANGLDRSVTLAGPADREAVPDLLRKADVFALPSFMEGHSLALLEAMATGLPVITTTAPWLNPGTDCLAVNPGDSRGILDQLRRAADPEARRRMGAAARRTAEVFSWESSWQRYSNSIFP